VDQLVAMLHAEGGEPGIPEYYEALGRIGPLKDETATRNVVTNIVDRLEIATNHGLVWQLGFWPAGAAGLQALQRFGPQAAPAAPFLTKRLLSEESVRGARLVVLTEVCRTLGAIGPGAKDAVPRLEVMATYRRDLRGEDDQAKFDALHEAARQALASVKGEKR
jgi:hypothetical protein